MKFPPPPPGAERRRHHRQDVFATVELEWEEEIVVSPVLNVSQGGGFLELPPGFSVESGASVVVHLSAGARTVRQPARVIRFVEGALPGMAVAWVAPGPDTMLVLSLLVGAAQALVEADAPRPAPPPPPRARPGELQPPGKPERRRRTRDAGPRAGKKPERAERRRAS